MKKKKLKKLAKKQAKELAREQAKAAKRKGKQDDDMMMDDDNFNTAPLVIDDEPSEDPRFTFVKGFQTVRDSNAITKDEYEYWLERMKKRTGWDNDHPLVRALFRGLGVHHAGLPRAYLDIVETLFRAKHINVVVATSTLAMGINMPCKTVVLAGDMV